jgi:hypothetical protein
MIIHDFHNYAYSRPLSSSGRDQGCQVTIGMIGGKYGYV